MAGDATVGRVVHSILSNRDPQNIGVFVAVDGAPVAGFGHKSELIAE